MTPERAQEIVTAINARGFYTIGLWHEGRPLGSLEGVGLAEMIEAKNAVEAANAQEEAHAKETGGGYTIRIVPDDRLIAAVYAIEHYPASSEPIVMLPRRPVFADEPRHVAIAVVPIDPAAGEKEEEPA